MIELVSREYVFQVNRVFASEIAEWQSRYRPIPDNLYVPEKKYFDWNRQIARHYSKQECEELNKKWKEEHERKSDKIETIPIKEQCAGTSYFAIRERNIDKYIDMLSSGIASLACNLKWESIFFLQDYKIPWYEEGNDFPPLVKAINYLNSLGVDREFTAGINVRTGSLREFFSNYFWLVRCNASDTYSFFSAPGIDLVMFLCQYGNIHLFFYSEEYKKQVRREATAIGMIEIEKCYEVFSESGAIEGRKMKGVPRK